MLTLDSLPVGKTGCYINDLNASAKLRAERITEIPDETALTWILESCPDTNLGCGYTVKDVAPHQRGSRWLNKLWVVVTNDWGCACALYNHDGTLYLYRITEKKQS